MDKPECCYLHKALFTFENGIREHIRSRVSNATDAEDLAQEVFLKISLAHARDEHISKVKNWIFTLTANTIAEYYRKKYRRREAASGLPEAATPESAPAEQWSATDFTMPLIKLLEEKYRTPLILSDIEQLPQKEIAARLQLSLPAVKSRIQRARVKLRELFYECTHLEFDKYGNVFSFEIRESCAPMRAARDRMKNS
jgi:RNA polymerase sigma-70 factor, ECF subfamily